MKRHTTESIERLAQEVLRKAGALTIPTDLDKVLDSLNVRVHQEDMEADVSGVLIVKADQRHVLVNKAHPENRQRFTIAHELGHLVLHDDDADKDADGKRMFIDRQIRVYQRVGEASSSVYKEEGSLTDPMQEREANTFAACLLMPFHHVARASQERDLFDEISVAALARNFGVSEQAMSIRLQQLSVVELNVVQSEL